MIARSQCIKCGGWYDAEVGFRTTRPLYMHVEQRKSGTCIGCEQTKRDEQKRDRGRWLIKARDTLRRHAKKLKPDLPVSEFARRYSWEVQRIAHDLQHAFENTCFYCWQPYASMPAGFASITVDIRDRAREPYYRTNTTPCCATCNREKSTMTPEQWARRLLFWEEWRDNQSSGPLQMRLFGP